MLEFHPLVKQNRLLTDMAQQEVRFARGAFDPKLETRLNMKEFDDKDYYSKWIASFSIPTWFPIDPKIGIEQNTGVFLNPEKTFQHPIIIVNSLQEYHFPWEEVFLQMIVERLCSKQNYLLS
jgi:hypothetical protein